MLASFQNTPPILLNFLLIYSYHFTQAIVCRLKQWFSKFSEHHSHLEILWHPRLMEAWGRRLGWIFTFLTSSQVMLKLLACERHSSRDPGIGYSEGALTSPPAFIFIVVVHAFYSSPVSFQKAEREIFQKHIRIILFHCLQHFCGFTLQWEWYPNSLRWSKRLYLVLLRSCYHTTHREW